MPESMCYITFEMSYIIHTLWNRESAIETGRKGVRKKEKPRMNPIRGLNVYFVIRYLKQINNGYLRLFPFPLPFP